MAVTPAPPEPARPAAPPEVDEGIHAASTRRGDAIFRGMSKWSGVLVLLIMAAIAVFLIWRAVPALQKNTVNFFTFQEWFPDDQPVRFGIAALAFNTLVSSVIAMLLAVPVGYGIALFIAFYSGRRVGGVLAYIVDLLAAVPSIIFGMWGLQFLMPNTTGLFKWLNDYLGFIPIFRNDLGIYTKSVMLASIVLAIMILPTVSAISREVFVQTPLGHIEAALALGATKWEVMRTAVFPFSRGGMISAAMLGLGRALGETIAVALILSNAFTINWQLTEPGGVTFASNIANKWNEAGPVGLGALIASGLVLYVITLVVNMTARWVIERRREFSGAN